MPEQDLLRWLLSAMVGVGLAAACGFRVFVPTLLLEVFLVVHADALAAVHEVEGAPRALEREPIDGPAAGPLHAALDAAHEPRRAIVRTEPRGDARRRRPNLAPHEREPRLHAIAAARAGARARSGEQTQTARHEA